MRQYPRYLMFIALSLAVLAAGCEDKHTDNVPDIAADEDLAAEMDMVMDVDTTTEVDMIMDDETVMDDDATTDVDMVMDDEMITDEDTIIDITLPTISFVIPADLAADVPINKKIIATFSKTMDPLTITAATFTVKEGATPVSGTVAYAGTTATFKPASDLAVNTEYTAAITTAAMDLAGNALENSYFWSFTTGEDIVAVDPVVLGQTSHFAILAGYAITTVPASAITGDVGISPAAESWITGFSLTDATGYATSPQVTGSVYAADMADPTPVRLTEAKGDLTLAYNDAAGRTPIPTGTFLNPGAGNLAGLDLVPGLYKFTGEAIATTDFTLTGGANDVWVFQIATTLNISNGVQVTLAGGAKAENIFWKVGTEATLGTTVLFYGTIMADASITMGTGATLIGRALAFTGTIALDQNTITVPTP